MIVNDDAPRRPDRSQESTSGWTSLHSWIFLAIVAIGLALIGIQNRYHYLSPLGLGKAYRIDKLFGGIQEFDPSEGWIKAQLQAGAPPPTMSMMPPQASAPAVPMNMPGTLPPTVPSTGTPIQPSVASAPQPKEQTERQTSSVTVEELAAEKQQPERVVEEEVSSEAAVVETPTKVTELTPEQKFAAFKKHFPDFGKDEFQLANDDLYPDWKKRMNPNGTWEQFLTVYGDFIQWWTDAGSPAESGFNLWNDFLKAKASN